MLDPVVLNQRFSGHRRDLDNIEQIVILFKRGKPDREPARSSDISSSITLAPSATFAPTASQASSSKTALNTQLSSVIPVLQSWIDDDTEDTDPIISSLDDAETEAEDLLSNISDDSDKDTSQGCSHSVFSLLSCIVDNVSRIKTSVTEGVVEDVTDQLDELTQLNDELEDQDNDHSKQTTLPDGADEITELDELSNNTSTKKKRTLATPYDYDSYVDFFTGQLTDNSLVNVPHRVLNTGGSSSAVVQYLLDYPFPMTVQGLFENPGFTSNFQTDIAGVLPGGDTTPINIGSIFDGQPWLTDLNSLSRTGGPFDPAQDGGVKTFVVTPGPSISDETSELYRYPREIEVIRNWLSTTYGGTPSEHVYTSTNAFVSNNQGVTYGKVLFQYDPANAIVMEDRINVNGQKYRCLVQYAGVKLWSGFQQDFLGNDMDPFYELNWPRSVLPAGLAVPGYFQTQQKREEVPAACTLVEDGGSSTSTVAFSTSTSASASVSAPDSSKLSSTPSSTSTAPSTVPFSAPLTLNQTSNTSVPVSTTSAQSTVSFFVPITLTTSLLPTSTSTGAPSLTNLGTYTCTYLDHSSDPFLGCEFDSLWFCGDSITTLYLPGSASLTASTLPVDQTIATPTATGSGGACSNTSSANGSSVSTTSSASASASATATPAASSTSACVVPDGCTNESGDGGREILCT
ncbi:hypothetical protein B0A50_08092 [Salinomyces thailandicus]|uniref:Uncharacterized protein n=1 Tax=Salinomyces thailandicus TaxID=706561 RepID=A0A4U0TKW6_9PEZI|nr:hypothetical protein B0A50_08092 [Salinomyces thailandica]